MTEALDASLDANPLLAGLEARRVPAPSVVVIFGASGDLTRRKLMPALYALADNRLLPGAFAILGVGRSELTDEDFAARMREAVEEHARTEIREEVWDQLAAGIGYQSTTFGDAASEEALADRLRQIDRDRGTLGNRVFYLAIPPRAFESTVRGIGSLPQEGAWRRVIIEKPFGADLASARELNHLVLEHFDEDELFRIDHYLGKETVQNLAVLRFANGIFEPVWNRQFIDCVQITASESLGIEGRASFYEHAGATRDIFQNHLLQLLALTAMEPSSGFSADAVRNEKVKVLKAVETPGPQHAVRGQYGPGFIDGAEVAGYRQEDDVDPGSLTETFFAAKLHVDNWRWAGTPFYVRCGKRMARRETTIAIQFSRVPHLPFAVSADDDVRPNILLIQIQPDEGVSMTINAKVPGYGVQIRTVKMDFLYGGAFRTDLPEAYERLILDAMLGDAILFTRADEVEEQWAIVDAVRAPWERDQPAFPNYAAGTWGPNVADELLHRDGQSWRRY